MIKVIIEEKWKNISDKKISFLNKVVDFWSTPNFIHFIKETFLSEIFSTFPQ